MTRIGAGVAAGAKTIESPPEFDAAGLIVGDRVPVDPAADNACCAT